MSKIKWEKIGQRIGAALDSFLAPQDSAAPAAEPENDDLDPNDRMLLAATVLGMVAERQGGRVSEMDIIMSSALWCDNDAQTEALATYLFQNYCR